jgi:polyhydroxybutyrate depolymerase
VSRVNRTDSLLTGLLLSGALVWLAGVQLHGQKGRPETISFEHGGFTRTARVHVPPAYDGKTPVPLVLSFHGRHGQGADQAELSSFHEVGSRHGFMVVYPDGVGKSWNALHGSGEAEKRGVVDVAYVDALLDRLSDRFAIDRNRIYASGMSNGGFFAHRLGCELSRRFAAIASVAGQMAPALARVCKPSEPVAVMTMHGTRDRIVPMGGGKTEGGGALLSAEKTAEVWRDLNRCGARKSETLRKGQVTCESYQDCTAPVTLCTVRGAGHTWPGGHQYAPRLLVGTTNRDIDASEVIWEFFQANPKRPGTK